MTARKNIKSNPSRNQIVIPEEELQFQINFQDESEVVAKYIFEKLISLTLTTHIRNKIDNQIPDHCFNFYHRIFNDTLQIEYIAFDRDDMDEEIAQSKEPIFFDNKYSGLNNWNGLKEPCSSKIDRSASTYIRVIKKSEEDIEKSKEVLETENMKTLPSTKGSMAGSNKNMIKPYREKESEKNLLIGKKSVRLDK